MAALLDSLEAQLINPRNYESPPLHLWHPKCNGNIPIYINAQGDWYHEGVKIQRPALVQLFAKILRREEDGEYYLVTPGEKWRIEVERHALLVTDINKTAGVGGQVLEACLNTGKTLCICEKHPLYLDPDIGNVAAMHLPHRLTAVCTRPAWYRLVEMAETVDGISILKSGNYECQLSQAGS